MLGIRYFYPKQIDFNKLKTNLEIAERPPFISPTDSKLVVNVTFICVSHEQIILMTTLLYIISKLDMNK